MKELTKKATILWLNSRMAYKQHNLNRMNKKLYAMMKDKSPVEKLISFERRVVVARGQYRAIEMRYLKLTCS